MSIDSFKFRPPAAPEEHSGIVGISPASLRLRREIDVAARTDAKVLITGETGAGKDIAARLIHRLSHRASAPFVAVNCAGLPDSLLESEIFGHARGSFTGAYRDTPGLAMAAHRGTLFLDEVEEMSPRMQALLLRFAESGEVRRVGSEASEGLADARIIAATNRDLGASVARGEFRGDLFYRLNVVPLNVPALRDRGEDILPLLEHFLEHGATRIRVTVPCVTPAVRVALRAYHWPGNVRELRNLVERILARPVQDPVTLDDLPLEISGVGFRNAPARKDREAQPAAPTATDVAWDRMMREGATFWTAVHETFMDRELTKTDVRAIVSRGLRQTRGSYRAVTDLFRMPPSDYKRFMAFLYQHDCHVAGAPFRHDSHARSEERAG